MRDGQRVSYGPVGARGNPVVESFFGRFKGKDLFLEARTLEERKGVAERVRYDQESRLHTGLGCRTPKEVMEEALRKVGNGITQETG